MATVLDVRNLTVEIPTASGWIKPVNDVSFQLDKGETLGVVGESGSGKTILSLSLMNLQPPKARRSRTALFFEAPDKSSEDILAVTPKRMRELRGRRIAMIFQEPMTALNPVMRVGAQIAEAIQVHEPASPWAEVAQRVLLAMERAAIPEPQRRAREYPHQLSGGLRQRVMIAMALAAQPSVLIADEPTTALDVTVQKQILELLDRLRAELGLSILFITHDLGVVAQVASRIAVMYAGRIVEEGPVAEVLAQPAHPYTQGLLRAAPRLAREKLQPIHGSVPNLHALPPGCSFSPRCVQHVAKCDEAVPDLFRPAQANADHLARCILAGNVVSR
jgi:peptide/nickel transport system ATP-binding protein